MSNVLTVKVIEKYDNKPAKVFLRDFLRLSSRSLTVLKNTEMGITCNGELLRTIDILHTGDEVSVRLPEEKSTVLPVNGEIHILYEDRYILILNKPSGTPVHPVKSHQEDTLANYVAFCYNDTVRDFVFRAVNRLDRNTSGVVIVAKDRHTAYLLQSTDIEKHYLAICHGIIEKSGTVNAPIGLSDNSKILRTVRDDGKYAVTHYNPIKIMSNSTLLDIVLETGRTHQIRCHMSHIGHPLMGDDLYGGDKTEISRQALHCSRIVFTHPYTAEVLDIEAPLPLDISNLIKE